MPAKPALRLALAALSPFACLACSGRGPALSSLTLEEKAAQVLMIGVEGRGLPSKPSLALLEKLPAGGVVLLGSNLGEEPASAGAFTAALQDAAARGAAARKAAGSGGERLPLLAAIDHEGGSVFRFRGAGITRLPPPSEAGERGPGYVALLGRVAGSELRSLGIAMNLAPVVELEDDANRAFLGSRAYGREAGPADAASGAFIEGLQSELVAAVAKHFPGNAGADPHLVLPELGVSRERYEAEFLPRFAAAIRRGVSAVMLSHVLLPALDPDRPASLSPTLIKGELKGRLGFRGVALTDDLCMRAVTGGRSPEKAAVLALAAGADLLMILDMRAASSARAAIVAAVRDGSLPRARLDDAVARVLALKAKFRVAETADPRLRAARLAVFPALVREHAARLAAFK
jgi:beta-N-acetylhexosaminidase